MLKVSLGRFHALELDAVDKLATDCETKFGVGLDFVTIISPFRHRFRAADRAEVANVEQMEKVIPPITREIVLCQYVCELVFEVHVFDLDLWVEVDSVK